MRATTRVFTRIATVGRDGTPHVVPVGMWSYNPEHDTIDVTGRDFDRTKKFRDVAGSGRAAIVVDEPRRHRPLAATRRRGARPRGERVVSWGIEPEGRTVRRGRQSGAA